MNPLVIFAHGKESGPWGSKITYLADIAKQFGAAVLSPDYSNLSDPEQRVAHLLALPEVAQRASTRLVLVGSSMGGYVSTVASQTLKPAGLFLLAPALGLPGYATQAPTPGCDNVEIVMGWGDTVIPVANVIGFAAQHQATLHLLNGDHRLISVLPEVGDIFRAFLQRVLAADGG